MIKADKKIGIDSIAALKKVCVVDKYTGCWTKQSKVWIGCLNPPGSRSAAYAAAFLTGRKLKKNQVNWLTCRNSKCANPTHVDVISRKERAKRLADIELRKSQAESTFRKRWGPNGMPASSVFTWSGSM